MESPGNNRASLFYPTVFLSLFFPSKYPLVFGQFRSALFKLLYRQPGDHTHGFSELSERQIRRIANATLLEMVFHKSHHRRFVYPEANPRFFAGFYQVLDLRFHNGGGVARGELFLSGGSLPDFLSQERFVPRPLGIPTHRVGGIGGSLRRPGGWGFGLGCCVVGAC